jgi:hypothetical protein
MKKVYLIMCIILTLIVISGCNHYSPPSTIYHEPLVKVLKAHNNNTLSVSNINEWQNITWNIIVPNESTLDYNLQEDNFTFKTNFSGLVRVQGCLHPLNNGTGNQEATLWVRVLLNSIEKRCLQASRTKGFREEGVDILSYAGTIFVEEGDEIILQWRTSNVNIILHGDNTVFDTAVSASINFERMATKEQMQFAQNNE